jgi:hypothetical protein
MGADEYGLSGWFKCTAEAGEQHYALFRLSSFVMDLSSTDEWTLGDRALAVSLNPSATGSIYKAQTYTYTDMAGNGQELEQDVDTGFPAWWHFLQFSYSR